MTKSLFNKSPFSIKNLDNALYHFDIGWRESDPGWECGTGLKERTATATGTQSVLQEVDVQALS